jgi:hypothetical protein
VDVGNRDATDEALVFSDRPAQGNVDGFASQLAEVIAHEVGHLVGFGHIRT